MSTKPLTLKGVIDVEEEDDRILHQLRREKQQLEDELRVSRGALENERAEREKLQRSVVILRRQLGPLHHALRAVFGEIELAIGEEELTAAPSGSAPSPLPNANDPRWESFKQTFPGIAARIIDALLAHQQMSYTQLKTLLRADYNTVKHAAAKLKAAGAIVKEGTMCRLNR